MLCWLCTQLYSLNYDLFLQKIAAPTPSWMTNQIESDLKSFKERGIYEEDLDAAMRDFTHNYLTIRCKIIQKRIFFYNHEKKIPLLACEPAHNHHRLNAVHYLLKFLVKYGNLPDLDFILSLEDGLSHEPPAPVMAFGKNKHSPSLVAFPDFEAIRGYDTLIHKVTLAKQHFPFEHKLPKIFWRGATTGGNYTLSNWKDFPRSRLVLLSKRHSNYLDAKFTQVVSDLDKNALETVMHHNRLLSRPVSVHDHLAFKYLIDIDGNNCTYSRFFWILLSNSLCLKVDSANEQWYYKGLHPYVHYLPIKADLSDIIEKIEWAEEHPQQVQLMISHANEFVNHHLMQEDVFHYVYKLLLAYAKLQRFHPKQG